ncbi:MAG: rhomboid family intramembrane serine protease [Solobacterium sp.]|nr:rhomboid family intramembrane serine protease [Solobacterium sp.]
MIITYVTIAVCVVLFIIMNRSQSPVSEAMRLGALIPMQVKRGQYWRLFTAGFLHLQIWHLLMNMYSLYNLGSMERWFGPGLYAAILFLSVIGGNLLCTFLGEENTMTLGISGGLYGLLAAYFVLMFKLGLLHDQTVMFSLARTALVNLVINLMPNVSRLGHAGGFLTGFAIAMLML